MQEQIKKAAAIIKKGGVVVFPTDTAYGLGGDFENPEVEEKILKIKNRTDRKFTLIAADIKQVEKYFPLSPCQKDLVSKVWPGPVSIIVNKKYAVRVPANETARKLAKLVGKPIIATSLNISGKPAIYKLNDKILSALSRPAHAGRIEGCIEGFIDTGVLPQKKESAIISCSPQGEVDFIRKGSKETNEQIRAIISS